MKIMDDTDENRELLDNVSMEVVSPPFLMQRMEPSQLLSNELMPTHNSLVVEMNNSEYLPNVSYATDELLGHDLTDEDRNLAAALVAVQLVQQQKQQQLHENSSALASLVSQTQLDNDLTTDQTESRIDKPVIITNTFSIHDSLATLKKFDTITEEYTTDDVKEEYSIKNETEHDSTLHSDSENRNDAKTLIKKSLPHKKRITRKLKKPMGVLKKIHKCSGCEQTFITLEQLNSHTVTCHSVAIVVQQPLNQFSCQICGLICTDQLTFFEHLKSHYEPVNSPKPTTQPPKNSLLGSLLSPLNCVNCGKNFRRQKTYETHIRDCHKLEDEFSEPEDLMEGIRGVVEANNRDSGEECTETDSKVWYGADTVTEHVCHLCGQVLTSDEDVCNHLHECKATLDPKIDDLQGRTRKKQRRKSGQLFCPHCDRVFSHRNSLMYHMRGHTGERPHQCDVCGKSFFAASALKVHMRLHSGDKPYKCEFCGRHFRQWGDLKYHCISIHSDEKQYQCEYCGKDFARKYSLIVHRRIHTGEKNYRCEFCGKTFRASSYLQNHRRIHTGEKPHPCEVCGKPFRVRSDMKRHLNTHTRRRGPGPASAPGRETTAIIKIQQDGNSAESIVPDQEDTLIEAGDELPPDGEEEADTEAGIAQESEDSIHYQRDPLETVRDGTNTLYVMPIIIS